MDVMMPAIKKPTTKRGYGPAIIDNDFKDHWNDPFVLKKVAEAKEAVSKITLPDHLKK
jgi:hypothetical protein